MLRNPRTLPTRRARRLAQLGLLALAACLAACGDGGVGSPYFPLEPGRNWQYRVVRTTMDGTTELRHAIRTVAPPQGFAAARKTLDGRVLLYTVDAAGVHRIEPQAEQGSAAWRRSMVLPHEIAADTTWQAPGRTAVLENTGPPWETLFRINVELDMSYRVEALAASVDTPAGRFEDCLVVRGRGRTNADVGNYIGHTEIEVESREWYAPGVGLVRMERRETTGASALDRGSVSMELDRYR
ncbi:MAG: TapB family protein [Gammaproteobacteria bacterium]